ncbi:hypothetical protein ABK040_014111 [Willaertia magna]
MNRRRVQYTLVLLVCSILFGSAASLPEKQEMDFGKIVHHIIIKFFIYAGGAYTAHYFLLKEVSKKGSNNNSRNNNNNEEEEEKEESLFWTFRLMFYAVVGLSLCFHVCFHLGVALLLLANNDDDNVNTTFEYIRGSVIIVASLVNLICGFTSVVVVVVGWFEQSRNGNVHVHQQFQLQYINGSDKRQKHYGTL